ncbi:hypothetical protein J7E29_07615 [Streptomyces sp. ISL-90]|nr:hypothetical protein [Streptomyces sp. ISL-90]
MTTHDNHTETTVPTSPRPLGYWLRVIDRRLDDAMRDLFAAEGISRRDWRRLNLIAGTVSDPGMTERLAARPERIAPLVERGWVTGEPGSWSLTEAGEAALQSLHGRVSSLRATVAEAVSSEDFATTMSSLEAIARKLGWSEDERMPRKRRRWFGHGRPGERGHGFGHRHDGEHEHRVGHRGERGHGFDRSHDGERGHGFDLSHDSERGHGFDHRHDGEHRHRFGHRDHVHGRDSDRDRGTDTDTDRTDAAE